jgi:hypothetical protein
LEDVTREVAVVKETQARAWGPSDAPPCLLSSHVTWAAGQSSNIHVLQAVTLSQAPWKEDTQVMQPRYQARAQGRVEKTLLFEIWNL